MRGPGQEAGHRPPGHLYVSVVGGGGRLGARHRRHPAAHVRRRGRGQRQPTAPGAPRPGRAAGPFRGPLGARLHARPGREPPLFRGALPAGPARAAHAQRAGLWGLDRRPHPRRQRAPGRQHHAVDHSPDPRLAERAGRRPAGDPWQAARPAGPQPGARLPGGHRDRQPRAGVIHRTSYALRRRVRLVQHPPGPSVAGHRPADPGGDAGAAVEVGVWRFATDGGYMAAAGSTISAWALATTRWPIPWRSGCPWTNCWRPRWPMALALQDRPASPG